MASVFICHRKIDAAVAERLALQVQAAGHSVWFDEWQINIGDSIVARIDRKLQSSGYLLLCFSSSGTSPWVDREWMSTLARQLDGCNVKVIPVRLTGGRAPAILDDIKSADLATDWDKGVQALLKGIR